MLQRLYILFLLFNFHLLFIFEQAVHIAFGLTYPVLGGLFQSGIFIQALLIPAFILRASFEYGADAITSLTFGSDGILNKFAGVMLHEICLLSS